MSGDSVLELRQKCREACKAQGVSSAWTVSANRENCENFLANGTKPGWSGAAGYANAKQPNMFGADGEAQEVEVREVNPAPAADGLAAAIAKAVEGYIKPQTVVDEAAVRGIVQEMIEAAGAGVVEHRIIVQLPNGEAHESGAQHRLFPLLLAAISCRIPCWLAGPAGSGKTRAAEECATVLGLQFAAKSFCNQSPASDLLGYRDAHGNYVSTDFRRLYEGGGVFCFDEIDNANPNILSVLNSALANGNCSFPDGQIKRHKDFVAVAGANTFGQGGDRQYVRNQIDAATLDRFFFVHWEYDESLEGAIMGLPWEPDKTFEIKEGGILESVEEWLEVVRAFRRAAKDQGLRMVISPRASLYGKALFEAGVGGAWIMRGLIYKGCDKATAVKLIDSASPNIRGKLWAA